MSDKTKETAADRTKIYEEFKELTDDELSELFSGAFDNNGTTMSVKPTSTVLHGQALAAFTAADSSFLTLLSRSGESLNIKATDNAAVSLAKK